MQDEEDTGDTFLTDIMNKKRAGSQASNAKKKPNKKVVEEEDDQSVDSDEYQDIVYDVEQTQALMDMADDFLH